MMGMYINYTFIYKKNENCTGSGKKQVKKNAYGKKASGKNNVSIYF